MKTAQVWIEYKSDLVNHVKHIRSYTSWQDVPASALNADVVCVSETLLMTVDEAKEIYKLEKLIEGVGHEPRGSFGT